MLAQAIRIVTGKETRVQVKVLSHDRPELVVR
jgi:hypothetical protein